MWTITGNSTSVIFNDGKRLMCFPKQTVMAHAHKGDKQTVDLRLMGSRKNIISFRYDDCNLAQENAEKTLNEIAKII